MHEKLKSDIIKKT